jgi:ferritin
MLIKKELNDAINAQIGNEFGASMQYLHIAAYFDGESLPNLAQFFYLQAEEEQFHAMKLLKYVAETGGSVEIPVIPAQQSTFESPLETAELSLKWEQEVTEQIYDLMDIAVKERDYIGQRFLDWFVDEQLEEVTMMDTLVDLVKRIDEQTIFHVENMVLSLRPAEDGGGEAGGEPA